MFMAPSGNSLDGICRFLYTYFRPQLDNIIKVTPSSYHWGDPQNLVHYDFINREANESFSTDNFSNPNIIFEFTQHILKITHYTLTTRLLQEKNLLKSWILHGSNDTYNWIFLHSEEDYEDFLHNNVTRTFAISQRNSFKYFRLSQIGLNNDNNNFFVIGKIEFFGKLCNANEKCNIQIKSLRYSLISNLFNIFISCGLFLIM